LEVCLILTEADDVLKGVHSEPEQEKAKQTEPVKQLIKDPSWTTEKLLEKYNNLKKVIEDNMPSMWGPMEFALSVKTILNMEGCTLPFGGILLGPSGGQKTVVIESFRECDNTFYTDSFSPKSLVSHNSAIKKGEIA
jgi:hypothetical protein